MADYLFWYFNTADNLLRSLPMRCSSDDDAIHKASNEMPDKGVLLEIYYRQRMVYRGGRVPTPRVSSAISEAFL